MAACGGDLTLVSLVIAPAFFFNWLSFISPPLRHACGSREVFDGGLPQHSASLGFAPPATLAVREKFLAVVCLIVVPAFPSITFLRVFPGFVDKPFRGVGVGFEEPHL